MAKFLRRSPITPAAQPDKSNLGCLCGHFGK